MNEPLTPVRPACRDVRLSGPVSPLTGAPSRPGRPAAARPASAP